MPVTLSADEHAALVRDAEKWREFEEWRRLLADEIKKYHDRGHVVKRVSVFPAPPQVLEAILKWEERPEFQGLQAIRGKT